MFDEKKLREKLARVLERPRYTSLSTGAYEPLINEFIEAVKKCEVVEPKEKKRRGKKTKGETETIPKLY